MALYGIDISTYQEVGIQGQDFTIIRATFGCPDPGQAPAQYVDQKCDQHYQLAKQQGKLRGVYHYAYPQYNSPIAEADHFVNSIQGYIGDALLVLDWEGPGTNNVAWAKAWLDHVYDRTGVRPLIYMSASVTGAADWSPVAKDYALWCAGYPNAYNVPNPPTPRADGSDMPYDTHSWGFATIWQYSSSAGTLDRDIAYMSVDAWNKFANPNAQKENPQPVPDIPPATPAPIDENHQIPDPIQTEPSEPTTPATPEAPADPANPVETPPPATPADPAPETPTKPAPPKVIVPEPTYFKIWELIVAIFKKLIGKK